MIWIGLKHFFYPDLDGFGGNQMLNKQFFSTIAIMLFTATHLLAQSSESTYDAKLPKGVVATYKGGKITSNEFEKHLRTLPMGTWFNPMERNNKTPMVEELKQFVQHKLIYPQAIKDKIDQINVNKWAISMTEDSKILNKLYDQEVRSKIAVTEQDAQEYYNTHKQEFEIPEYYKIRNIFVDLSTTKRPTEADRQEGLSKINKAYSKLKTGANFIDVAKEFSEDDISTRGEVKGEFLTKDIPNTPKKRLAFPLENAATNIKPGEYTSVLTTSKGYHILYLEEHRLGFINPFEEVKSAALDRVKVEKAPKLQNAVVSQATTSVKLTINYDILKDTTASSDNKILIDSPYRKISFGEFKFRVARTAMVSPNEYKDFLDKSNFLMLLQLADYGRILKINKEPSVIDDIAGYKTKFLAEQWLSKKSNEQVKITDTDVKNYYDQNTGRFMTGKEYLARQIYIKFDKNPQNRSELMTQSKATIDMVLQKLKNGTDFSDLARQYSSIDNAKNGGLVEWTQQGPQGRIFDMTISKMTVGQISDVVPMPDGFQIIKLENIRGPFQMTFEESQDKARSYVTAERQYDTLTKVKINILKSGYFKYDSTQLSELFDRIINKSGTK